MPSLDLGGQIIGRLRVVKQAGRDRFGSILWECLCDCGNTTIVRASHLSHGRIHSCGCIRNDRIASLFRTHGMSGTTTYKTWRSMIDRCTNPNATFWKHYGGRGISVCQRWLDSFENFLADMGEKPSKLTLDRKKNDKGYYKDNCRWVDQRIQTRNTRRNHRITFNGETKTLAEWAETVGLNQPTLRRRLLRSHTLEEALFSPLQPKSKRIDNLKTSRLIDITGGVFGRLTVIERAPQHPERKEASWLCQCSCGNQHVALGTLITHGQTQSCGCLRREMLIARNKSRKAAAQLTTIGPIG